MSMRSSIARIAGALVLLCAAAAPLRAQDSSKPAAPAPKDAPAPQRTQPQATSSLPPKAPAPIRPSEEVSPGRKVSFPNDI
jgi:hypothetical protein